MAVVALWLWRALPASRNPSPVSYPQVLRSMWHLLRSQPGLRQRTLVSALAFASVSVLFSTMALQLSSGPLGLDDGQIGLIGLAGAAGAGRPCRRACRVRRMRRRWPDRCCQDW